MTDREQFTPNKHRMKGRGFRFSTNARTVKSSTRKDRK